MNNRDRAIIEYWLRYENKCSRDVSFSANCDKFDIQSTSELIIRQMKILPYAIGDVKSIRFLECILADERELPRSCHRLTLEGIKSMIHLDLQNTLINTDMINGDLGGLLIDSCSDVYRLSNINILQNEGTLCIKNCDKIEQIHLMHPSGKLGSLQIRACENIKSFECMSLCSNIFTGYLHQTGITSFPQNLYHCSFDHLDIDCRNMSDIRNIQNVNVKQTMYVRGLVSITSIINILFCTAEKIFMLLDLKNITYDRTNMLMRIIKNYTGYSAVTRQEYIMDMCINLIDADFALGAEL